MSDAAVDLVSLFYRFGAALAIGILIGLQREYAHEPVEEIAAGVRTFALLGLAGCLAALLADRLALPAVFLGIVLLLGGFVAVSYAITAWLGDIGMTTEVAAVLTILLGSLCYRGEVALAVALAVTIIVLLSLKLELHAFAHRLKQEDVYATLRFAIISVLILPILPNRSFGPPPFDVLNPYKIWLMVVFISGISFVGYLLNQLVDARRGIPLAGLLGGLVSSTAVTLTFTERSRREPALTQPLALGIIIAWTVMFGRVFVEVATLNLPLLAVVWQPLLAAAVVGALFCAGLYFAHRDDGEGHVSFTNPFELRSAIRFGLLYAIILLVSRAAQMFLGAGGLYLSSVLAGLTDVDAITLSMAELSQASGSLDVETAARAITLATMSNTLVKGGLVLMGGSMGLRRYLAPALALILLAGVGVAFLI